MEVVAVYLIAPDREEALAELVRAHADLARLDEESADARERRRQAARRLVECGRAVRRGLLPSWA